MAEIAPRPDAPAVMRKLPERGPDAPPALRLGPTRLVPDCVRRESAGRPIASCVRTESPRASPNCVRTESSRAESGLRPDGVAGGRRVGPVRPERIGRAGPCGDRPAPGPRPLQGPVHRQRRAARQARAAAGAHAFLGARRRPGRDHRSRPSPRSSSGSKPGASPGRRPRARASRERDVALVAPHPGRGPEGRVRARRRAMPLRGRAGPPMHGPRRARVPSPAPVRAWRRPLAPKHLARCVEPQRLPGRGRLRPGGHGQASPIEGHEPLAGRLPARHSPAEPNTCALPRTRGAWYGTPGLRAPHLGVRRRPWCEVDQTPWN